MSPYRQYSRRAIVSRSLCSFVSFHPPLFRPARPSSVLPIVLLERSALFALFRILREPQVVKSYYCALRGRGRLCIIDMFYDAGEGQREGCSLRERGGKHRSLGGNKVRLAARICILDKHVSISGAGGIVSCGRFEPADPRLNRRS